MNYLITGLPRSRTAWLAVVVGSDDAPCLHEGLILGVDGLRDWMAENPGGGNSDSGLPMVWRQLGFDYRLVVIERPEDQVIASYARVTGFDLGLATEAIRFLSRHLDEWKYSHEHLRIDYRDLSDNRVVQHIIDYCQGGKIGQRAAKSDLSRIAVLQGLQIEQRGLKLLGNRSDT